MKKNEGVSQEEIADRARKIGVPVLPARPIERPQEENPVVAVCGACGIEVRKIMWMACNKAGCPLSSGTTMCAPDDLLRRYRERLLAEAHAANLPVYPPPRDGDGVEEGD